MAFNFVHPSTYMAAAAAAAASDPQSQWPDNSDSQHIINNGVRVLQLTREREGRCPSCGTQTHRLRYISANKRMRLSDYKEDSASVSSSSSDAVTVHKEPLTVDGAVYQGRCLLCHPFAADAMGEQNVFPGYDYTRMSGALQRRREQQYPHQPITLDIIQDEYTKKSPLHRLERNTSEVSADDNNEIVDILCRMREKKADLSVQISSFHALWVLSWDVDNARAIGRVGGIPTLVESLRYHLQSHLSVNNHYNRNNHMSSPSSKRQMQLQSNGLATLQNLSVNKVNKESLMDSSSDDEEHGGFVPLLLLAMSTFLHNAEIQRTGCNALANLLCNGSCYKSNVLSNGGLEAVKKSAEIHKDDEGLIRGAYKCLCLLGQKPTSSQDMQFAHLEKGESTDKEVSLHNLGSSENTNASFSLDDVDSSVRSAQSSSLEEL